VNPLFLFLKHISKSTNNLKFEVFDKSNCFALKKSVNIVVELIDNFLLSYFVWSFFVVVKVWSLTVEHCGSWP
jgi:hypothetical protein